MICNHPVMYILIAVRINTCRLRRGLNQRFKQISIVIIVAALQQRADTLKAHTSINRGFGQIFLTPVFKALVLHEYEVPNLNKPIAVFIRAAGWATPNVITMIVENLCTRVHRVPVAPIDQKLSSVAILMMRSSDRPACFFPDIHRLFVGVINRDQQLVAINAKLFGD